MASTDNEAGSTPTDELSYIPSSFEESEDDDLENELEEDELEDDNSEEIPSRNDDSQDDDYVPSLSPPGGKKVAKKASSRARRKSFFAKGKGSKINHKDRIQEHMVETDVLASQGSGSTAGQATVSAGAARAGPSATQAPSDTHSDIDDDSALPIPVYLQDCDGPVGKLIQVSSVGKELRLAPRSPPPQSHVDPSTIQIPLFTLSPELVEQRRQVDKALTMLDRIPGISTASIPSRSQGWKTGHITDEEFSAASRKLKELYGSEDQWLEMHDDGPRQAGRRPTIAEMLRIMKSLGLS